MCLLPRLLFEHHPALAGGVFISGCEPAAASLLGVFRQQVDEQATDDGGTRRPEPRGKPIDAIDECPVQAHRNVSVLPGPAGLKRQDIGHGLLLQSMG